MRQFLALPFIIVGVIIGVIGLFALGHPVIGLPLLVLGGGMLYGSFNFLMGRKLTGGPTTYEAPPVPTGFTSSFWSKNMAYDHEAGAFWLRDESGAAAVLQKSEITSCQAMSDLISGQTTVGPKTAHLNTRMVIRTANLSKPVWTINFNGHPERTDEGARRNYAELNEWDARMSAILKQKNF